MIKTYPSKQLTSKVKPGNVTIDLTAVVVAVDFDGGTSVNVGSREYYLDIDHDDFVDDWKEAREAVEYADPVYPFSGI